MDTTEQLHFHFSLSCIGEGNVNPLQCSCLENPREGGAWWAAGYGVAQSQTRLRRLSSSSSTSFSNNLPLGSHYSVPCESVSVPCVCVSVCACVSRSVVSDSAHQAPLSRRFSRQECWSGLPLPSPFCVTARLTCVAFQIPHVSDITWHLLFSI